MPWRDWQFWIVTALALAGAWLIARPFLPRKRGDGAAPGCPNCASGSAASKPRRVALTIDKKRVK
jgi:hypothetical protein